jgi:putative phage-type endonuclease
MEHKIRSLIERPQIPQRTPEWYRMRKTMITASEVAAALDIKPFASYAGSPRAFLLEEKRKTVESSGIDNVFTRHGQKYEDEARDIYCEMTGEVAYELGLLVHPRYPWLGCSVDGITGAGYVLEIKCPLSRKIEPGVVPHHYYPQVQICMEVCDLDETKFIQYKPESVTWPKDAEFVITSVPRNREWFADVLPKLEEFYREMTAPPQPSEQQSDPAVAVPWKPVDDPEIVPPPFKKLKTTPCFIIAHKEEPKEEEEEKCILFINPSPDDST